MTTMQYGEWQTCPKCMGSGYAPNYSHQIPMDIDTCDVCSGVKIIKRPESESGGMAEALEDLIEAIPKQTNDADWWPDELTRAVEKAKSVLGEDKPSKT